MHCNSLDRSRTPTLIRPKWTTCSNIFASLLPRDYLFSDDDDFISTYRLLDLNLKLILYRRLSALPQIMDLPQLSLNFPFLTRLCDCFYSAAPHPISPLQGYRQHRN